MLFENKDFVQLLEFNCVLCAADFDYTCCHKRSLHLLSLAVFAPAVASGVNSSVFFAVLVEVLFGGQLGGSSLCVGPRISFIARMSPDLSNH